MSDSENTPASDAKITPESETPPEELTSSELEKLEEEKLRAKFPTAAGRPMSGHSVFLQKRLAHRQKYFDSGDYQMAKQKPATSTNKFRLLPAVDFASTGDAIPTPETVPVRKTSIIQQTKFNHPAINQPTRHAT